MKLLLLAIAFTGALALSTHIETTLGNQSAQSICDQYHHNPGDDGEQACADALERENAIYACNINGTKCQTVSK